MALKVHYGLNQGSFIASSWSSCESWCLKGDPVVTWSTPWSCAARDRPDPVVGGCGAGEGGLHDGCRERPADPGVVTTTAAGPTGPTYGPTHGILYG